MEVHDQNQTMLNLMHRSAFRVEQGVITNVNPAAARYFLKPGMEIAPLLATGGEEYAEFSNGCLYLTLELEGLRFGATVVRTQQADIFVLEEAEDRSQLRALALAAMELRVPLANAIAATDKMLPVVTEACSDDVRNYAAQLNRRLMQMQRIIGNMSDCASYGHSTERFMEYAQICSLFEEQLAKAAQALSCAGISLEYSVPSESIYTLCNPQKLERAVYNILSNAAKFSPPDGIIHAQLRKNGSRLIFSVTDQGSGIENSDDIFTRYLREPGLENGPHGIGLGMALIRSTATLHGGAVLLDQPESTGTRVSMTMKITQSKSTDVRSTVMRIDYAGERDHCLLELSDVLPAELYRAEDFN